MHKTNSQAKHMALGQLYTNDIADKRILQAMAEVPREAFVPEHLQGAAYSDQDLDIGGGRVLMAPLAFAKLLDLAAIKPGARMLSVGALNGYYAAVMAKLGGHIVAIETDAELVEQARKNLQGSTIDVEQVKNLADGYALSAPYDAIVVHGAVDVIPEALASQLSHDGSLVAIRRIAPRADSKSALGQGILVKRSDGHLQETVHFDAPARILSGFEQKLGFAF